MDTDTDRLAAQIRTAIKGARGAAVDADDLLWLDLELGNALDALDRLEAIAAGVTLDPRPALLSCEELDDLNDALLIAVHTTREMQVNRDRWEAIRQKVREANIGDPRPAPDRWDSCCGLLEGHDGDHMPSRILAIRAVPTPPDALREAAQAFVDIWGETETMESSHAFAALRAALEADHE